MTPGAPRVPPLPAAEWNEQVSALLTPLATTGPDGGHGPPLNIFTTLAHQPKLLRDWLRFGGRLLQGSTLPPRDRELVILRVAHRCGATYEWAQHVRIAPSAGVTAADIAAVGDRPGADPLPDADLPLLAAVDELLDGHDLSDAAFTALSARYDTPRLIEFLMLAGHYQMLAGVLNTLRVQVEDHPAT